MQKTKLGQELIASLGEARAHARGAKKLRMSTLEVPEPAKPWPKEQIVRLRKGRTVGDRRKVHRTAGSAVC